MESLGGFSGGFCFKPRIHPDGKENTQKHSGGQGSRVGSVKFSLVLLMENAFNKTALTKSMQLLKNSACFGTGWKEF